MSSDAAIRVDGLGKRYHLYARPHDRLRELLWYPRAPRGREVRALDDVSFAVRPGETIGVVGRNAAGKSTLLQCLAGTLQPTSGVCEVRGRVAALLELGAGFHPEFTGRENVLLNATVLGLGRKEIAARFDAIAAFADIGDFIDAPVRTYSSGMYVRLAFAVAASVEPDVLLVDEALAVGDLRFQLKCLQHTRALQARGTTIVLVSHSVEQVRRFCERALWLEGGRLVLDGPAATVTDRYVEYATALGNGNGSSAPLLPELGSVARIRSVTLSSAALTPFEPLRVTVEYEILEKELPSFLVGVAIYTLERRYVFGPNTALDGIDVPATPGVHRVTYVVPRLPLLGGTYMVDAGLFVDRGLACLDYRLDAGRFVVETPYFTEGLVHIEHRWEIAE